MADYDIISASSGTRERGHAAVTRSFVGQHAHNAHRPQIPPLRHSLPVRRTFLTRIFNMCLLICHSSTMLVCKNICDYHIRIRVWVWEAQ